MTSTDSAAGARRRNASGESTRVMLMEVAERLFATRGIEAVTLRGTIRWFSTTERERGLARIEAIARGVGEALRVRIEFEVLGGAPVTSNVPEYAALVDEAVTETGRATSVDAGPITATDDVAHLLAMAPGAFFGIERRVGSEEDLVGAKEIEAATQGRPRTKRGGIRVEHFEVFLRALFQAAQVNRQIFLFGPRAELIEAGAGAS